ncbi:hypothetical protein B0H21DRAFT_878616 [Amylocystis lapponica]|nr:hypothetical protein B0H21DRAFT_878616 [Amylocystis lapponica]
MSNNNTNLQQELLDAYSGIVVANYSIMASTALLFFDWAITFTREVQQIWRMKFSGVTVVFLLLRYVALAERITLLTSVILPTVSNLSCVPALRLDYGLVTLTSVITNMFIVLRVWGIWGNDWRPHLVLIPLAMVAPAFNLYLDTQYTPVALGLPVYGCSALWHISNEIYMPLAVTGAAAAIASNVVVIIVTWMKTYSIKKQSIGIGMDTPLTTLILRDGAQSLPILCSFVLLNFKQEPSTFCEFHVIFLSRFMLGLRVVYPTDASETYGTSTGHMTSLRFASHIVGNMGASLETGQDLTAEQALDEDAEDVVEVPESPSMAGPQLTQGESDPPVSA